MPAQLGGGIRDLCDHRDVACARHPPCHPRHRGRSRDPELVREACRSFPGRVAVGIAAKGGQGSQVEGWAETSELSMIDLARRFEDAGVAAIVYTDIERDGVLKGLNSAVDGRACPRRPNSGGGLRRPGVHRRRQGACCRRPVEHECWRAPSPAARSTTGASIPWNALALRRRRGVASSLTEKVAAGSPPNRCNPRSSWPVRRTA